MTIKVLEHNGIYTAYRRVVRRTDDGQLYESVKRLDIPIPPPKKTQWQHWAASLLSEELDVGIQIFFDKWNFGNGTDGEREIYDLLYNERALRILNKTENVEVSGGTLGVVGAAASGVAAALNFPVIKK